MLIESIVVISIAILVVIWVVNGGLCLSIPTNICDETNQKIENGYSSGNYAERVYSDEQYDIWNFEAPFGKFWVGVNGKATWIIFSGYGSINSEYNESYVIKYLVGDELKTLIIESTDENIHLIFISKDEKPYIRIQKYGRAQCNCDGTVDFSSRLKSIIWIYIPEPEINSEE